MPVSPQRMWGFFKPGLSLLFQASSIVFSVRVQNGAQRQTPDLGTGLTMFFDVCFYERN